jgi:hypothetical protein
LGIEVLVVSRDTRNRQGNFTQVVLALRAAITAGSILQHRERRPSIARLQPKKQRTRILDIAFRSAVSGRLEGDRRGMIGATDECQRFCQPPHGVVVDRCFVQFAAPY